MTQLCRQCARINPADAVFCYHDGAALPGHGGNGGPINAGAAPFPRQFVFPSGLGCRNFDQLAMTCQEHWTLARDVLKQGFLSSFLGGLGRSDLAIAANDAARNPDSDRGLDQFLAKLPTHALQPPKLKVEPSDINLGLIPVGADRDLELHLVNLGMRLLYGSAASDCKWLSLGAGADGKFFQFGAETTLAVHVKGQHLRAGNTPMEGKLVIDSNGGSVTVTVRAEVPIVPFADGVLAGSTTPRQIAEKAKTSPREAAALFESGAVAKWFARNGWTYPVQGPSASGLGGVQQFFEALGLARAPKLELKTTALALSGSVGQTLRASIELCTRENKILYAHAVSDQHWAQASEVRLSGRAGVVNVCIAVPDRGGETLHARITVLGNGNQRFVVPVTLAVAADNPFSDLAQADHRVPPDPAAAVSTLVTTAIPTSGPPISQVTSVPTAALATAVPIAGKPLNSALAARLPPYSKHLLPLCFLAVVLVSFMIRDTFSGRGDPALEPIDAEQRLLLQFNYGPGRGQTDSFGLRMFDPETKRATKQLTYDPFGKTNSTMALIDGRALAFGKHEFGKWDKLPGPAGKFKQGQTASWAFLPDQVVATQTVEIIPGEPIEVTPQVWKRLLDTCLIRYKLVNRDSRNHKVGLRIVIDTLIGSNDGAPFTIPGVPGLVSTFKDLTGTDIPDFIQAQESPDLDRPGAVVQVNMRLGGRLEPPSRVSLTRMPGFQLESTIWTYEVPLAGMGDDSCIVLYWDPQELAPGASREVGFTYGLGNVASQGKLGILNPSPITAGETFTLVALVADAKPGQTATLKIPPGFELAPAMPGTQEVNPGPRGADGRILPSPVTWRIQSKNPGNYMLSVATNDGLSHSRRITIRSAGIFR